MSPEHQAEIERVVGARVQGSTPVGGGCIADARRIQLSSGGELFVKCVTGSVTMFANEANGLRELAKANAIRVPTVIYASAELLVLDYIQPGPSGRHFMETFGRQFAQLHRYHGDAFGFYEDNFIGLTPQTNTPPLACELGWPEFFYRYRLLAQFRLAEERGYVTDEMAHAFTLLDDCIETILATDAEPPTLLHGDLWRGNYLVDNSGEPVLIDPAVYYGHREADLAMTTLFGGFDETFYRAYNDVYPLAPGAQYREPLYQLYHILNHLNLFGAGYYGQAMHALRRYV